MKPCADRDDDQTGFPYKITRGLGFGAYKLLGCEPHLKGMPRNLRWQMVGSKNMGHQYRPQYTTNLLLANNLYNPLYNLLNPQTLKPQILNPKSFRNPCGEPSTTSSHPAGTSPASGMASASAFHKLVRPCQDVGGSHNYGPFLGPSYNTAPNI